MMSGRAFWTVVPWLFSACLACSTPNPNVRVRRLPDGRLQVDGPLAGPFKTQEALAAQACTIMTSQPAASNGKVGFEYCALYYYAVEDAAFFLSYLSNVSGDKPGGRKFCEVPQSLHELGQKTSIVLGPAHTHPINREFSPGDLGQGRDEGWSPLGASRVFVPETGRIWDRELLVFYGERDGRCSAYRYSYATRVVYALRGGEWMPIGKVEGRYGTIQLFQGQGWLP